MIFNKLWELLLVTYRKLLKVKRAEELFVFVKSGHVSGWQW